MEYTISIEKNKDGWLTGQCEQLPQAISQGKDMDDLMENMRDAIELVLEYQKEVYRRQHKSNRIVKPLVIRDETKRFIKIFKGKRVYS